jgi:formate dehydrogenase iron-sulfur subunit
VTIRVYVPKDSAARSVGAELVALAIQTESAKRGINISIVRNGSRGALWLEPLVEVVTPEGRVAYGPVTPTDVESLFDSDFHLGGEHPLSLGKTNDIEWLSRQDRVTFARVGVVDPLSIADFQANGGLVGLHRALSMESEDPDFVGAVAQDFLQELSGELSWQPPVITSTSAATLTREIAGHSPIGC